MDYIKKSDWKKLIKGKFPPADSVPVTELKLYIKQPYNDNPPTKFPAFDLYRDSKPAYDNDVVIGLHSLVHSCYYNGQFYCLDTTIGVPEDSGIHEEYSWIVGDYVYWYVYGYQDTFADLIKFDKNQYRNEVKRFLIVWAEYIKNHSDEYFSGAFEFANYEQTQELIKIMEAPFEV